MLGLTLSVFMLIGPSFANDSSTPEDLNNTITINDNNDIKINDAFYHFIDYEVEKESKPMMSCKIVEAQLDCNNSVVRRMEMPMLTFWPLNTDK